LQIGYQSLLMLNNNQGILVEIWHSIESIAQNTKTFASENNIFTSSVFMMGASESVGSTDTRRQWRVTKVNAANDNVAFEMRLAA
jgi:hypothetical protein